MFAQPFVWLHAAKRRSVKVIGVFPDNTGNPIIYPVALTANAKSDAMRYLSFLRTQREKKVFEKYGFNFLVKPTS